MNTNSVSHTWRKKAVVAATASALAGLATTANAQSVADAEPPASTTQIEGENESEKKDEKVFGVIVVTASRREASIVDTPTAISAYGGDQLGTQGVGSFSDLTTQSPNIQFSANGGNTNIAIRGIGTDLQLAGNDPGVAFHVDGVYVAEPALGLATLFDVDRVEILRGPQGTLFGRNATGGAINIISNTPTAEPSFGFEASAGLPEGEHLAAFASGPVNSSGTLLGRLSVQQTYQKGDVENLAPSGPDRLNDQNDYGGRLQIEWQPTDDFSARLMANYLKSDTAGPAYYLIGTPNTALGLPSVLSNTFIARPGEDEIAVTRGAADMEETGLALFVDWEIAGGNLRAILSKRESEVFREYDDDGTVVDFTSTSIDRTRESTYGELIYTSDGSKRFSYILGANYFDDLDFQNVVVPVLGFPAPVILGGEVKTESFAVFGNAEFKLSDAWKVFGGARYSSDKKDVTESNNFIGSIDQSDDWSKPTFEFGTSYEFNNSTTGYLKYATGYKSGGYSAGALSPSFSPETNSMWELGLKGAFFDDSLQANLALFRMSYQDLQVNQVVGVTSLVTNAAEATINGFEVELVQRVTPELSVEVFGGWLDAQFDQFSTQDSARPALGLLDLSGNSLAQAPEFTAGVGPFYERDLANGGVLTLSARYDWKSRVFFSEFNLPRVSQDAAGRLNAYANYELPGGKWQVGLYGRNLTDETTLSSTVVTSAVLNSIALGTLQPRREVGLQLRYRY